MDLFDDNKTLSETPKMSQSEFNETAIKILENIASSYRQSWHSRPLKDEELPDESVCDKCTGCGTFTLNGETKDCVQDREQGECYHRYQDAEEFGIEVETEIDNIYGLLAVEIVPDNTERITN